jgi:hypothetical protein
VGKTGCQDYAAFDRSCAGFVVNCRGPDKLRSAFVKECADGGAARGYGSANENWGARASYNPQDTVMASIKLHLDAAELDAVARFSEAAGTKPEAVLYTALNRLMLDAHNPALRKEILETWEAHGQNLPLWADSACSVHAYEGKADDEPAPSKYMKSR